MWSPPEVDSGSVSPLRSSPAAAFCLPCQHSGNQGTMGRPARAHITLQRNFAKDQALQAWRGSPSLASLAKGKSLGKGSVLERASRKGLGKASSHARVFSSPSQLCLPDIAHMGSAPSVESRTRQSAMMPALSLSFPCIKQSTKQRQAKEQQDLPLW